MLYNGHEHKYFIYVWNHPNGIFFLEFFQFFYGLPPKSADFQLIFNCIASLSNTFSSTIIGWTFRSIQKQQQQKKIYVNCLGMIKYVFERLNASWTYQIAIHVSSVFWVPVSVDPATIHTNV